MSGCLEIGDSVLSYSHIRMNRTFESEAPELYSLIRYLVAVFFRDY